jgi:beta-glucosidase
VVQLYVHATSSAVARPEQELRAFTKVDLAPGEERQVTLHLPVRAFAYFDAKLPEPSAWRTDPGVFEIRAASSSRDLRLRATMTVPVK